MPSLFAHLTPARLFTHVMMLLLVCLWTFPTAGLMISSFRDKDQLTVSGWWTALGTTERQQVTRTGKADAQIQQAGGYVISGSLFEDEGNQTIVSWGMRAKTITENVVGNVLTLDDGTSVSVEADGSFSWLSPVPFTHTRGKRIFFVAETPPTFTLDNYKEVLTSEGIGRSFINSFTVTIPATIIPILIAAFAAYALSWMQFPGRPLILAFIVGLLVVPLQMALIPILRLYNDVGNIFGIQAKGYVGIWLAHTGFGLPLAIYLLRNYMASLPREIMESARMDGASHFMIFRRIALPLSIPALASFCIFQFLWVWNDLLVATVFLGVKEEQLVLTGRLREMLGSRGGNWEILTSGAFVSIFVPLLVFFALQRFFVRGLLAGSVKGG